MTSSERCANDDIFQDMSVPSWDKDTMKYFTPFPTCGGYGPGDWYIVGGESQVVGPICELLGPVVLMQVGGLSRLPAKYT